MNDARVPQTTPRPTPRPTQFGLTSVLLVITLIAAIAGIARYAPGLGIGLLVLVMPALLRSMVVIARRRAAGEKQTTIHRVLAFLAALMLATVTALSAGLAFTATCFGGMYLVRGVRGGGDILQGLGFGIIAGILCQIGTWVGCCVWLWKRRSDQVNRAGDVSFFLSWFGFSTLSGWMIAALTSGSSTGMLSEFWGWGLPAVAGFLLSLVALCARPRSIMAVAGCSLGIPASLMTAVLWVDWAGNGHITDTRIGVAILLAAMLLVASGIAWLFHNFGRHEAK